MRALPEFRRIHDRFRPQVLRQLSRFVGADEAEDLAQIVMRKVAVGLSEFRGASSVSNWIHRIATNAAMDRLRRKRRPLFEGLELVDSWPDPHAPSPEAMAIRHEMNSCIREFIDRLPEAYRTVIVLSELEGLPNAEVATILGISLDAVKIRLHRARARLRENLKPGCDLCPDEGDGLACDRKP